MRARVLSTLFSLLLAGCSARKEGGADAAPAVDAARSTPESADAAAETDAGAQVPRGYGTATLAPRARCGGEIATHIDELDARSSFVDGDDLLALVNRSPMGGLPPTFAPKDLVDLVRGEPRTAADCERQPCLRSAAASALNELLTAMKAKGFVGKVESAFRSYGFQCGTFETWVKKAATKKKTPEAGFCAAAEQSALPGHSQHQLGTTVDLFTEQWAEDERGVFREGFGCTPAGRFIREHAEELGFVLPYPLHPDDRHPKQTCAGRWDIHVDINPKTGYRFEHWHLRYVGKDAARRYHDAWQASGPGTPGELTLEQWLRNERGVGIGDAELPVCDGCNCGACATLAPVGRGVCDTAKGTARGASLHLDGSGAPVLPSRPPSLVRASVVPARRGRGLLLEAVVDAAPGTLTQPPITGRDGASYLGEGASFEKLAPYPATSPRAFPPLDDAWVVGIEPVPYEGAEPYPYRAALTDSVHGRVYNRANVRLPARAGTFTVRVEVPEGAESWKVALLERGAPKAGPVLVPKGVTPGARSPGAP